MRLLELRKSGMSTEQALVLVAVEEEARRRPPGGPPAAADDSERVVAMAEEAVIAATAGVSQLSEQMDSMLDVCRSIGDTAEEALAQIQWSMILLGVSAYAVVLRVCIVPGLTLAPTTLAVLDAVTWGAPLLPILHGVRGLWRLRREAGATAR